MHESVKIRLKIFKKSFHNVYLKQFSINNLQIHLGLIDLKSEKHSSKLMKKLEFKKYFAIDYFVVD